MGFEGCATAICRTDHACRSLHRRPGATRLLNIMASPPPPLEFEHTILITARPEAVMGAFFDPSALPVWWDTVRSVTTPRPLGVYAVEWDATPFRDELLGTLGGVFYGTVMDYRPGRAFSLAGAYWLPPDSLAFGPMALDVRCRTKGTATRLRVRQSGSCDGPRWERYYRIITTGWEASLLALQAYLEHRPLKQDGAARAGNGGRDRPARGGGPAEKRR